MKKIVFLLFCVGILGFMHPVKGSMDQADVTYETLDGDSVLVIEIEGTKPIRIERGNEEDRYTITQQYYEDGHYVFFGYAHLEETLSHFDGYVLVVSEEGHIEYEQIVDEHYLEEVKAAKVHSDALYLLVEQSINHRPASSEFRASLVLKVTDEYEVLHQSDAPLKRMKILDGALFMSDTYAGNYEWGLIDGELMETGDILGLEEGGQYIEEVRFFSLCEDSRVSGEAIEAAHSETYPGHYQFTCHESVIDFTVHPLIEGVTLFEKKAAPIAVSVSEGRVWLNDDLYVSDTLIDEPGYHTLKIEGAHDYELKRSFTLTSGLEGVEEEGLYDNERTLYFSGRGFLNEVPVKSGHTITKSNDYELIVKGLNDYTETVNFSVELEDDSPQFNQSRLEIGLVTGAVLFTGGGIFIYKKRK